MYDEDAQDEATITVIATGLDAHGVNTPVNKAMAGFNNYKPKVPSGVNVSAPAPSHAAVAEASATAAQQPAGTGAAPQQGAVPTHSAYRPLNQTQINIPDFLKNKK